ncbi:serine/threonine kinase 17b (apoptosis-inducing) [Cricetulus griseus]
MVVVHTFNPSTREAETYSEFEASLVCRLSVRLVLVEVRCVSWSSRLGGAWAYVALHWALLCIGRQEKNVLLVPQNILLSSIYPLGDIKIVDFGMSRKIGNACELREIMGTPEYLAPEILNYDPITTATDMWNIGIIAYMLLTHTSPFVGEDNQETYLNISQVNVDYSDETFSSVSQLATDFIQSLLVKNPEKRLTAESCLSHSWLQQWDFGSLFHPEETSGSSQIQDHTLRSSEDKTPKSSCNGSCGDREDKENIPEDSSMVSKRFRFDDSLPSPHELVPDLLC